jgi:hypothetical protein
MVSSGMDVSILGSSVKSIFWNYFSKLYFSSSSIIFKSKSIPLNYFLISIYYGGFLKVLLYNKFEYSNLFSSSLSLSST